MSEEPEKTSITFTVPIELLYVIFALVLPVWLVYSHIHGNERENARSQEQKLSFVECIAPDFSNASVCLKEAVKSEYDQTAEYYDLKAQQDMAKWALLMFVVTGIGVGYLALTLHTTKETLEEAARTTEAANRTVDETRRIGEAQVRAYLTFENAQFNYGNTDIRLEFEIHNSGQSPARFILASTVSCTVFLGADAEERMDFHSAYDENANIYLGNCRAGDSKEVSIPMEMTSEQAGKIRRGIVSLDGLISVSGLFKWEDVFGVQHIAPFSAHKRLSRTDVRNVEINTSSLTKEHVRNLRAKTAENAKQQDQ